MKQFQPILRILSILLVIFLAWSARDSALNLFTPDYD